MSPQATVISLLLAVLIGIVIGWLIRDYWRE